MKRKVFMWLIERLYKMVYEPTMLDKVNQKLIRPVPGLLIDGVQYFEFVNLGDMPRQRMVHYGYLREEMVMGIDRELQVKLIDKMLEANDKGEHSRVGALGYMFKDIVSNITTMESLYNMASVMYFDAQEDLVKYDLDYNRVKISRFKSITDKSFFFSHLLQNSLKSTADKLPKDIQQFLNENEVRLNAWRSIISEVTESKS
jgi:hypothetical protein